MTFDQIVANCEREGLTLTGNRHGYRVEGLRDRFGRPYGIDLCNTRTLWDWALERFN